MAIARNPISLLLSKVKRVLIWEVLLYVQHYRHEIERRNHSIDENLILDEKKEKKAKYTLRFIDSTETKVNLQRK